MHELAVTENILSIVTRHAEDAKASNVTDIHLVIGQLSSIVDDSVQFYWEIIAENTICEKAKLHFSRIPARFQCLDCGHEYVIPQSLTPCVKCGSINVELLAGEEFFVESIEIQKQPEEQTS